MPALTQFSPPQILWLSGLGPREAESATTLKIRPESEAWLRSFETLDDKITAVIPTGVIFGQVFISYTPFSIVDNLETPISAFSVASAYPHIDSG